MRRIISVVLVLLTVLTATVVFSIAGSSPSVGDLNGDGRISIKDCNMIKRYIAGAVELDNDRLADIDGNGHVDLVDSNMLSRAVLGVYTIVQPEESDGISISEYTVVYPQKATVYESYAVEILCDYVSDNLGLELSVTDDSADEVQYEILIGATNRAQSKTSVTVGTNKYLVQRKDDKIVLRGGTYMIGGAVGELTYKLMKGDEINIDAVPETEQICIYTPEKADSVILMIGDGMGFNHIKFASNFYRLDRSYGGFIAEKFPNSGEATTYSLGEVSGDGSFKKNVTDSAAGATALATGWKTQNAKLGINALGMSVQSVRELAHSLGMKTAVVSTEDATGATPSGFTVHNQSRSNTDEIREAQARLVESGEITYLAGGVYADLLNETKKTLDIVSTDSKGFYVMIEEAHIDKACDSTYSSDSSTSLANYVYRFNTAIQYAATFAAARPGTVLIVTADHETGALSPTSGMTTNYGHHTDQNVPVFAMGAGTEIFNGTVVDNTDIAKFTASVFGAEEFGGVFNDIK